jgi:glucosamine--fructose-6-phosphate aminotransferase (isomerizing)
MHGPVSLVADLYPVLMFAPTDAAAEGLSALAADLRGKGAAVFVTGADRATAGALPAVASDHPDADAICLIQSLYAFVVSLSLLRGTSVDEPRHLRKVTRTR